MYERSHKQPKKSNDRKLGKALKGVLSDLSICKANISQAKKCQDIKEFTRALKHILETKDRCD